MQYLPALNGNNLSRLDYLKIKQIIMEAQNLQQPAEKITDLIKPTAEISSLLPWSSNYFTYKDNLKIHYFDVGPRDKECLLCVHGNPTWSFYFRSLISKFSGRYRVIAADFLGMGLSSKCPNNSWRASDRAQELEALLNHLGIRKFSIVMHDWGGPIGTRVALNRI